ncbi:MAG TPA: class I lanthipeptide [Thermoanaerobaculia bacterium]|jgi:hypothetical protein|nr:class I lanthipeptide [Thermoanaerobaculia bacterium]
MKKKIARLSLTKETLRSLENVNLDQVAGGAVTDTCQGVDTCPARSCVVLCGSTRCSVCCP